MENNKAVIEIARILETVASHDPELLSQFGIPNAEFLSGSLVSIMEGVLETRIRIQCPTGEIFYLRLEEMETWRN